MEQQRPNYYAILTADVRYDKRICANAKLLFAEITALSNATGYCFATNKYFANLYQVTSRTIINWLRSLDECGYINIEIDYIEGTKAVNGRYISLANIKPTEIERVNEEQFSASSEEQINEEVRELDVQKGVSAERPTPGEKKFTRGKDPYGKNLHHPHENNFTTPREKIFTTPKSINNNKLINNNYNIYYIYTHEVDKALENLNKKIKSNFQRTEETETLLLKLFSSGYSIDDVQAVIDKKYRQWNGTTFAKYLRPSTLFGSKFDSYLNELTSTSSTERTCDCDAEEHKENEMAKKVLSYFNEEYLKKFKPTQKTIKVILEREGDGYTFEDFKQVIYNAHICLENKKEGDERAKYFCPVRIFNAEWFDKYLNYNFDGNLISHHYTPRQFSLAVTSIEDLEVL